MGRRNIFRDTYEVGTIKPPRILSTLSLWADFTCKWPYKCGYGFPISHSETKSPSIPKAELGFYTRLITPTKPS
jgi:hypothetical protein